MVRDEADGSAEAGMDDGAAYRIGRYRPAVCAFPVHAFPVHALPVHALPVHEAGHLLVLPLDREIVVRRDPDGPQIRVPPETAAVLPCTRGRTDAGRVRAGRRESDWESDWEAERETEWAAEWATEGGRAAPGPAVAAPGETPGQRGARALAMAIPERELVPAPAGPLLVDVSAGLGRVVADMVRAVGEEVEAGALDPPEFEAACDRIAELLRMVVAGRAPGRPSAPGQLAEVEAVVRRYVRANVTDPALTGAVLAQRLGWSLRQIQLALQRAGTTPRALIREERLRLVRDRLRDPADHGVSITDLAHAAGFSSAGALSTAFRRRFGTSPRESRRAARRDQAGTGAG